MIFFIVNDPKTNLDVCKGSPESVFDYFLYLNGVEFFWDIYRQYRDHCYAGALVLWEDEQLNTEVFMKKHKEAIRNLVKLHPKILREYINSNLGYNSWFKDMDKTDKNEERRVVT